MSMIIRTTSFFLMILFFLFITNGSSKCNEQLSNNFGNHIKSETPNNQNIIVRKYVSEKYTVFTSKDKNNFAFDVYPNPTFSDEIKICFKNKHSKITNIKLINLNSNKYIKSDSYVFKNETIKFYNFEKGWYLITIFLENGECYSTLISIE